MRPALALLLLAALARAGGIPALEEGKPAEVLLPRGADLVVFSVEVPPGAEALHLLLASNLDLDFALAPEILGLAEAKAAPLRSETADLVEHLRVPAPEPGRLHLHVWPDPEVNEPATGEILLFFDRPGRRLLPPRGVALLPEEPSSLLLFVPAIAVTCALHAESDAGAPELSLRRGKKIARGAPRGTGTGLLFGVPAPLEPGFWEVEVGRPSSPRRATVALSLAAGAPAQAKALRAPWRALAGLAGVAQETVDDKDDYVVYCLDLPQAAAGAEVRVELAADSLAITAFRDVAALRRDDWAYASVKAAGGERLVIGGRCAAPMGRYWIKVEWEGARGREATLRWKTLAEPPGAPYPLADLTPIAADGAYDCRFRGEEDYVWFALPPEQVGNRWFQLLDATQPMSLLLFREDTGALWRWGPEERWDAAVRVGPGDVLPEGVAVRLGVGRADMEFDGRCAALHVRRGERPLPPPGYLPPFRGWGTTPRERALAATVQIAARDGDGTGVLVTPGGLILTCEHVLADEGLGETVVALPRSERLAPRQAFLAKVEARDERLDLALLRVVSDVFDRPVDRKTLHLPFAPLGRSAALRIGDPVEVAGYPQAAAFGPRSSLFLGTGVVSGFFAEEEDGAAVRYVVSDAQTGSGNSGGGIFDASYRLMGIVQRSSESPELVFSLPQERIPPEWLELIRAESGGG